VRPRRPIERPPPGRYRRPGGGRSVASEAAADPETFPRMTGALIAIGVLIVLIILVAVFTDD
jgi:hypothetical protein